MIFIKGDWPFYWPEHLSSFTLPEIWSSVWPTGLGGNQAIILPLKLYLHGVVFLFVNRFGLPWEIIQIIFFFGLFIALSVYSSYKLTKSWIGSLIYTTNTWILLVFFGGQIGIALAYAIAPLVLMHMMKLVHSSPASPSEAGRARFTVHSQVFAALIFSIEVMFDIRIAFLTMLIVLGYTIFHHFFIQRIKFKPLAISYSLLALITILLHAFWILPSIFIALNGGNVASIVDTSSGSLEFLSFAKFENSLSLLHPNWPENIFGKVSFMKPEFLLIPMVAFASLLFLDTRRKEVPGNRTILFFAIVGLVGAFLAKGTQEPFGGLFTWLYSHVLGFNLFRDPVKFYILIAISYSVLIPHSLKFIAKKNFSRLAQVAFVIFWLAISMPFISNKQIGKLRTVPPDYVRLKEYLVSEPEFFRTLWIPSVQRFAFTSDTHPTISYQDLFKSNFASEFKKPEFQTLLSELSIKYVIIPYDSEGEIFLNDRKYDEKFYRKTITELDKVSWLKRVEGFDKIIVYELPTTKPHFFLEGTSSNVTYKRKASTEYLLVNVETQSPRRLVFSEGYDKGWVADSSRFPGLAKRSGAGTVHSSQFEKMLNSFDLPKGKYNLRIYYEPQKWTTIGYIISGLTLLSILGIIGTSLRKK